MTTDTAKRAKELGRKAAEELLRGNEPAVEELLRRAKSLCSVSVVQAHDTTSNEADTDSDILIPEGLMAWLGVTRGWIAEKRRPRCAHPLPALFTRPLRFSRKAVTAWLEQEAQRDTEHLQHKETLPVRHRPRNRKRA